MTEVQRASEMTIEQIEDVLREMNWAEIHKAQIFNDYGDKVVLYTDGEFTVQGQGTFYRDPDAAGVIGYLSCFGQGNIDRTVYYEGRWERAEDGEYVDEDGTLYTENEMLIEAIEEGDWGGYDEEIEAVLRQVAEERAAEEVRH